MRTLHLHLDDALTRQPSMRMTARRHGLVDLEARDLGPALRLWTRPRPLAELRRRLRHAMAGDDAWLTFAGSGDFHHVSLPLIARAANRSAEPLTVVHFDNHPDWVRFGRGLHCGSWVGRVLRLPSVMRLITVGVCSKDIERPRNTDLGPVRAGRLEIYPYRRAGGEPSLELCGHRWPTMDHLGEGKFLELLLGRIETRNVYVTIDKDALRPADAITNWDQGELSLEGLAAMVRGLALEHDIVGADVVGDWSPPRYARGVDGWLKRAEASLDQPRRALPSRIAVNERANEFLLRLFAEVIH
jgi:hypothetical protein